MEQEKEKAYAKAKFRIHALQTLSAFFLTLAATVLLCAFFDLRFENNDDILIRNILSGAYNGTPDAHCVYLLYPLGLLLSGLSRIAGNVPWFGCLLVFAQFFGVFEVLLVILTVLSGKTRSVRLSVACFALFALGACVLPHMVILQYTFTAGFLAACAVFLLAAGESRFDAPAVFMLLLSFLLRSKIALLLLPFALLALALRWYAERSRRILVAAAVLLGGMAVFYGADLVGYGSPEWKAFREFNEARTGLYDYTGIAPYENAPELYDEAGITPLQTELLQSYNFALDESIDAELFRRAAEVAKRSREGTTSFAQRLRSAVSTLLYEHTRVHFARTYAYPETYAPINLLAAVFYLILLCGVPFLHLRKGEKKEAALCVITAVCCFAGRMLLWLYLYLQGRVLIRVSIPLFLAEVLFLGGRILASSGLILRKREIAVTGGTFVVLAFLLFGFLARYVPFTMEACAEYDRMQEPYRELYAALSEEEDFAFLDVYSTVADTEKIFGMPKDDLSRRELAGGWICRSPLYEAKLENNGHTNAGDALRYERALWVCRTSSDMKTVLKALSESDYRAEVITVREVGDFSVCRITTAIPD